MFQKLDTRIDRNVREPTVKQMERESRLSNSMRMLFVLTVMFCVVKFNGNESLRGSNFDVEAVVAVVSQYLPLPSLGNTNLSLKKVNYD